MDQTVKSDLRYIEFDKVDGFIKNWCGTKYLTLFGSEKFLF